MKLEKYELNSRIFGAWVYYGPSKVWPMERHLQFRFQWWWGGTWLYFNPTGRELQRASVFRVKAAVGMNKP